MNSWKSTAAGLGAAALALLSGTVAHAQNTFIGAGSSAVLNAALQGAVNQFPGGTAYVSGNISAPTGSVTVITATAPATNLGTVTLVDGNGPNTNSTTWFLYVQGSGATQNTIFDGSFDSTIGNRALFNRDTYTSSGVPSAVSAAINGQTVNIGFTDIRPEDALTATNRTMGLGYNTSNPIRDVFGNSFFPIPFTIAGNTTTSIGAAPVVIAVSANVSGSDSLLRTATNVNRATLGNILSGNLVHVGDLVPGSAANTSLLTTYVREPISGTYNTTEFCSVATVEGQLSGQALTQELGVSSAANSNPLNESGVIASGSNFGSFNGGAAFGGRVRAIGTGQMVKVINQTPNALGYAFYSVGNFTPSGTSANANNLKYLTVDGVDPIFATYSGGTLPGASGGQTLANIANGAYPIWSIIRAVTLGGAPNGTLGTYLTSSIPGANGANVDFIPASLLTVFRSHRGTGANNGVVNPAAEAGSDVGGAIFLKVNELDYNADFNGRSLTNARQ